MIFCVRRLCFGPQNGQKYDKNVPKNGRICLFISKWEPFQFKPSQSMRQWMGGAFLAFYKAHLLSGGLVLASKMFQNRVKIAKKIDKI